jgi:hypothetical protein
MASKVIYTHRRGLAEDWKVWLSTEGNKLEDGEIGIIDSDPHDYPNHLRLLVGDGQPHSYEEMPKFAYAKEENGSVVSHGYDYAEYFKWADDVPEEYRTSGRFVTIAENTRTIRPAQPTDKVLGITSHTASIIGNWDEGSRNASDGWAIVGMLGIIEVLHDETCVENGYAMIGEHGIATHAEDAFGYKIVNVNNEAGTIEVVLGNDSDMISRIKSEINDLNNGMGGNENGVIMIGQNLQSTSTQPQVILGSYNEDNPNATLIIGGGPDEEHAINNIEIERESGDLILNGIVCHRGQLRHTGDICATNVSVSGQFVIGQTELIEEKIKNIVTSDDVATQEKAGIVRFATDDEAAEAASTDVVLSPWSVNAVLSSRLPIHTNQDIDERWGGYFPPSTQYTHDLIAQAKAEIDQQIEDTLADANGNIVVGIYETKTDAAAKLDEAKAYADSVAADKADTGHNHDVVYYTKGQIDSELTEIDLELSVIPQIVTNTTTMQSQIDKAETKEDAVTKLNEAKTYADSAANTVKNDLLNGAGDAYDTLKELGDLINSNVDAIDALEAIAANKADKDHAHDNVYATKSELNDHKNNKSNPHGVTPSQIGAAATKLYTATIPTSGWSASAPYTLDVTVNGILDTDIPIVDIVLSDDATASKSISENWVKVGRITTSTNKITVYCYDEIPSVALPIQLKVVR